MKKKLISLVLARARIAHTHTNVIHDIVKHESNDDDAEEEEEDMEEWIQEDADVTNDVEFVLHKRNIIYFFCVN